MILPGQHQRHNKTAAGDRFGRVAISFTPDQIRDINALAEECNRSFSATVAYLVEHALKGRMRSQSPKGH